MELQSSLTHIAHHIAEQGTHTESETLELLATAIRPTNPGVADALVDWDGAEVARLRAFGIAHGILRSQPGLLQQSVLTSLDGKLRVALAA